MIKYREKCTALLSLIAMTGPLAFAQDPAATNTVAAPPPAAISLADFEPGSDAALWLQPSASLAARLSSAHAHDGTYALQVTLEDSLPGIITVKPSHCNFTNYLYMSLWLKTWDELNIQLEDQNEQLYPLKEAGRLSTEKEWKHLFYRLPLDSSCRLDAIQSMILSVDQVPDRKALSGYIDTIMLTQTMDITPPNAPAAFSAMNSRMPGEAKIEWRASGDDESQGEASGYIVKMSGSPIRDYDDFEQAASLPNLPVVWTNPATTIYLQSLAKDKIYYIAARAFDDAGNASLISQAAPFILDTSPYPSDFVIDDFDQPKTIKTKWTTKGSNLTADIISDFSLQGPKCIEVVYTHQTEEDIFSQLTAELDIRNISSYPYLMMWVYGRVGIVVSLYNSENRVEALPLQQTALQDGWNPVYFDLSAAQNIDKTNVKKLIFNFDPHYTNVSNRIFIDNVQLKQNRM